MRTDPPVSSAATIGRNSTAFAGYIREPGLLSCRKGGRALRQHVKRESRGLVSIITVVLNSYNTITRTIDSVSSQSYPEIEYIVVDGGSTDGTLEVINEREEDIDIWLSERDQGISDAFNKGIALASGEFVAILNADDWIEENHVEDSVKRLMETAADFSFGNLLFHGDDDLPLFTILGDANYSRSICHAMPAINHPTVVCRRSVYDRNGLYDKDYKIAMDYEWLLRNHNCGARGTYVPGITAHMSAGGISNRRMLESIEEVRKASMRHGYPRLRAMARYYARVNRVRARLMLERTFPPRVTSRLRSLINDRYRHTHSTNSRGV